VTTIQCPHCGLSFPFWVEGEPGHELAHVPADFVSSTAKPSNAEVPVTHEDPRKEFMDLYELFEGTNWFDPETFHKLMMWGHRVPYGDRKDVRSRVTEFLIMAPPGDWKWKKIDDLRTILEEYLK